jgi:DNA-binding NtrC family response regulator
MPVPALVVCREPAVLEPLRALENVVKHLQVRVCPEIEEACVRVRAEDIALVLAHLPAGQDAGELTRLLWAVARARRLCSTVILTDAFQHQQALHLLRAGAADYLEVPRDFDKLAHLVAARVGPLATAAFGKQEPARAAKPRPSPPAGHGPDPAALADKAETGVLLDDLSADLHHLREQVRRVAPQETTLLLTGQTGTGKTRLARLIHELSPRRAEPFLVVDCGALSASLIESELFGHARGAFTGADRDRAGKLTAAGRGTLLLDEVNSLPLPLQAKLLRAVDERLFEPVGANRPLPLQARLIAASNADLQAEVEAGRFRADLFYRLNVVAFFLPPLRERRSSIAPLAEKFLRELAARNRPDVEAISAAALRALQEYDWPGNVRELRNVLERAVALCAGPEVQVEDLPGVLQPGQADQPPRRPLLAGPAPHDHAPGSGVAPTLAQSKQDAEVRRILEALRKNGNNRRRAAAELGISRMALYKKLHKYGLMDAE